MTPHYTDKRSGRFQNKGEEAFLFYPSYKASKWNLGGFFHTPCSVAAERNRNRKLDVALRFQD